jgi:pimeloyl-ACP methyl ester carboxylesterase
LAALVGVVHVCVRFGAPSSVKSAVQTQFRTIDDLQIRFAESEQRDDYALLLSPWPESLFAFQPMWERLGEHAHLVAVGLPAFGYSEGRESLFAPRAMGEFVVRFADDLALEHPHVVGPDVGTGAALFAAADNRAGSAASWSAAAARRSRSGSAACSKTGSSHRTSKHSAASTRDAQLRTIRCGERLDVRGRLIARELRQPSRCRARRIERPALHSATTVNARSGASW